MNKKYLIGIVSLIFLTLLIGTVSAGWFSDFFGKVTGQASASRTAQKVVTKATCSDTDNGQDYSKAGKIFGNYTNGSSFLYSDNCPSEHALNEMYCKKNVSIISTVTCPTGTKCEQGACIVDKEVICFPLLKNGESANKIDLVFVPDDYMTYEELFSDDFWSFKTRVQKFIDNENGLFSKEPFKSKKQMFNIYLLNLKEDKDCQISDENGGDFWGCKVWAEEQAKKCGVFDSVVVVSDDLKGTGGQSGSAYAGKNFAQVTPFRVSKEEANINPELYINDVTKTFIHEFGHSFGGLKDEYFTKNTFTLPQKFLNCDSFGCPKWCSGNPVLPEPQYEACAKITNETDCKSSSLKPSCEWIQLYGKNVCRGSFSEENFGVDCLSGYGCYQGCEGLNGYRSTQSGDMMAYGSNTYWGPSNSKIVPSGFSPAQRQILLTELSKYDTKSKYKLRCDNTYSKKYHLPPCKETACSSQEKYVRCDGGSGRYVREVCTEKYTTICSANPSCKSGDKQVWIKMTC